jgi:hypothetical protein
MSNKKKTVPELNKQTQLTLQELSINLKKQEELALKYEKKEYLYFYSFIGSLLISGNLSYLFFFKDQFKNLENKSNPESSSETQKLYNINKDIVNCLIISASIMLLSIKGKSSLYNRIITPTLSHNTNQSTPPTRKKRAILWTMHPQLKVNTILFEHFFRSTYSSPQWIAIQKGIWALSDKGINNSISNMAKLHNSVLKPKYKYNAITRKLIYLNSISWILFSLDIINLAFFELNNYINGYNQLNTISPVVRSFSNEHRFNCLIRHSLGNITNTLHLITALFRYYTNLLLASLNHNIVASFHSSKNPSLLLLKSLMINLLPIIGFAIYAFINMQNDNIKIQDKITKIRKTFTIISLILISQGSFWLLPLLNPINPKQTQGIFKTCNFIHIYKVLFKAYLENSKHNIESLIFDSFLIINPEKDTMPDLAKALTINKNKNTNPDTSFNLDLDLDFNGEINNNTKKKSDLMIYLQNLNIRLLMPIPVISAIIGATRNISAVFLKNLFEYNKESDRANPILSVAKFIFGLTLIPSIMILTLCKNLIDYPNKIVMNAFNKTPLAPHKLTAFILSMASILGLHNIYLKKPENNNTSIPIFLTLFTLSTVQLMAFICTIINYATPKKSPSDIFKNYITHNNNYENLENNLENQYEEEKEEKQEEKAKDINDFSQMYNNDFSV